jgi:hypothetical protein
MKALKLFVLLILLSLPVFAQYQAWNGDCSKGGQKVVTQGSVSSTLVLASYPLCLVSVYYTGTTNQISIFSTATGGTIAQPFTANTDGSIFFYTTPGVAFDVLMSGAGMPAPKTLTGEMVGGAGGGGGSGISSLGMTAPTGMTITPTSLSNSGTFVFTWTGQIPSSAVPNNSANTTGTAGGLSAGATIAGVSDGCLNVASSVIGSQPCVSYPSGSGIPIVSAGSSWGSTLGPVNGGIPFGAGGAWTVSTAPALSAANMINFPQFNQNTTGYAGGLAGCPNPATVAAGSICYSNGSAWNWIAGNTSSTAQIFQEQSGVPSFVSPPGGTTVNASGVPLAGQIAVWTNSNTIQGLNALPNGTLGATQTSGDNTAALATDAFVQAAVASMGTVPAAGQVAIGNSGGTAYAPQTLTQDISLTSAGVATVVGAQGKLFPALAAFATSPYLGYVAGAWTALNPFSGPTFTGTVTASGLGGSGTQCVSVTNTGQLQTSGVGPCGTGGGGGGNMTGSGASTANDIILVGTTGTPLSTAVDAGFGFPLANAHLANSSIGISGTTNQIASSTLTPSLGGSTILSIANPFTFPGPATLAAGTTSAPSLVIPSGVAMTSPSINGQMWNLSGVPQIYDGTHTNSLARVQAAPASGNMMGASGTTGVLAAVPGTSLDFTNGLVSIAPIGTGVGLSVTGDASVSDLQRFFLHGNSGSNWGMTVQPYSDSLGAQLAFQDSSGRNGVLNATNLRLNDSSSDYSLVSPLGLFAQAQPSGNYISLVPSIPPAEFFGTSLRFIPNPGSGGYSSGYAISLTAAAIGDVFDVFNNASTKTFFINNIGYPQITGGTSGQCISANGVGAVTCGSGTGNVNTATNNTYANTTTQTFAGGDSFGPAGLNLVNPITTTFPYVVTTTFPGSDLSAPSTANQMSYGPGASGQLEEAINNGGTTASGQMLHVPIGGSGFTVGHVFTVGSSTLVGGEHFITAADGGALYPGTVTYTATQTASLVDNGKKVQMNCPSSCAYVLPNPQVSSTFSIRLVSVGIANAGFIASTGMTVNGSSGPFSGSLIPYISTGISSDSAVSTNYVVDAPLVSGTGITFTPATNGVTISATGSGSTAPVFFSSATALSTSATDYIGVGQFAANETTVALPIPRAATIANLACALNGSTGSGSYAFTVRVGASGSFSDTSLTCTINSSSTNNQCVDQTDTANFTAGATPNQIDIKSIPSTTPTGRSATCSVTFQ